MGRAWFVVIGAMLAGCGSDPAVDRTGADRAVVAVTAEAVADFSVSMD